MTQKSAVQWIGSVDTLRFSAIALVMLYHFNLIRFGFDESRYFLGAVGANGWAGVDLFFVISGFLIGGQLIHAIVATGKVPFGEFYLKRAFRILPSYFAVLAIFFLTPFFNEGRLALPIWRYLSFSVNLAGDYRMDLLFASSWSLCTEEQFYLAVPLLLTLFWRLPRTRTSAVTVVGAFLTIGFLARFLVWWAYLRQIPATEIDQITVIDTALVYAPIYTHFEGLLFGVLIASIYGRRPDALLWERIKKHGNAFLLSGLFLLVVGYYEFLWDYGGFYCTLFGYFTFAAGFALIFIAAISSSCFLFRTHPGPRSPSVFGAISERASKFISVGAGLSYSLYLTHELTYRTLNHIFSNYDVKIDNAFGFMIYFFAAFIPAKMLQSVVESPFLGVRDRVLRFVRARRAVEIP